jgi:hypothetical protein
MGLTIEETLLTKEMMLVSFLQTLGTCCMNLMNPLFFPHKFNKCLSGVNPLWWKVVLHREPKSRRVVANTYGDCMDTHDFMSGLEAPLEFLDLKSSRALVGAVELNREESLLVV